jgi:DNA polymerase III subunit alpha
MKRRAFLSSAAASLAVVASPLKGWGSRSDTDDRRLRAAGREGLTTRLAGRDDAHYHTRLQAELNVINRAGLSWYFCLAHELVAAARKRGIPVFAGLCGASASLVCWALGLSEIDPVEHSLPFETFINWRRHRGGYSVRPYFYVPVCARRQHELWDILAEQHGVDRVAFARFDGTPARNTIYAAEAGLGWNDSPGGELLEEYSDRDCTLDLSHLLESDDELQREFASSPRRSRVLQVALELERNLAVNCGPDSIPATTLVVSTEGALAGMSEEPVRGRRRPTLGIDRCLAEGLGLFTIDCPPLPALTALALNREPPREPDCHVWDMIGAGDTEHVMGLESHLHDYLRRFRPSSLSDLAAIWAVHRPGPIEAGIADLLVNRKRGRPVPQPLHPLIERVTASTHGVLLFKEQLVNAVHAMAGFDLAEADVMRRSLGKKRPAELEYWETRFTDAARHRGVEREAAHEAFELFELFAGYLSTGGYALAHATLSLRMATLKAHAPREFALAVWEAYDA